MDLKSRIDVLNKYNTEETWYITRHDLTFSKLCYSVSILENYKSKGLSDSFENYHATEVGNINSAKTIQVANPNYRAMNNAYYLGLIKKNGTVYNSAEMTAVFDEIKKRCGGVFENTSVYYDIIERQIEKVYFSSSLDEERDKVRRKYRLFPLFSLYKVLLLVGDSTKKYEISMDEFYALVCTMETYEQFFEIVLYIIESRQSGAPSIKSLATKFAKNIRYHNLLKELKTLEIDAKKSISIKDDKIDEVRKKVYQFETSKKRDLDYIDLLYSTESLIENEIIADEIERGNQVKIKEIPTNPVDVAMPHNLIIYGAPGTGKSYALENEYRKKYFNDNYLHSRVTFNSNYSFYDFVGVYKPIPIYVKKKVAEEDYFGSNKTDKLDIQMAPIIDYTFVPGPFLITLCKALSDNTHNYLLIIEEINRADVAAVFGDVFQLLDRAKEGGTKNCSEYGIAFNKDVMDYLAANVGVNNDCFEKDCFVKIPSNMYIFATMNSTDQNVNRMDSAFKRRWDFRYLGINENDDGIGDVFIKFNGFANLINWNKFRKTLNDYLSTTVEVSEDKLIGPYFIDDMYEENGVKLITQQAIKYKLLMYLKDDVLRHNSTMLFRENWNFGVMISVYDNGSLVFSDEFAEKIYEIMEP